MTANALAEIDRRIAELEEVRGWLESADPTDLDGWYLSSCGDIRLLQFHPNNPGNVTGPPVKLAKAIGRTWTRVGDRWESRLIGDDRWAVVIHHAEPQRRQPDVVDLGR